ncbi:NAD-dependent epimerase/dehydratase [Planctomycetales bacterium 10988]|nr:NAD-dependent epimerase/dehydratase [Planctomycetales bacterium 10988]
MKIVVIGGSGLIGKKLIPLLIEWGHDAISASPSSGVNTLTKEGLAEVLTGVDTVVDVTNSPSFEDNAVLKFFETSTRNILAAEAVAGVQHHVALSVVGADCIPDSGYMRAKVSQEHLIETSGVPYTILRATQFFEFLPTIAGPGTDTVRLPVAPIQPIAGDDVAKALAVVALEAPKNDAIEIAGPESLSIAEFVRKALTAMGYQRNIVDDPLARYFGAALDEFGLKPRKDNPLISSTYFDHWFDLVPVRK